MSFNAESGLRHRAAVDFPGLVVGNGAAFIWVQPGLTGNTVIDVNTDNIVGPNIDGIYVPGAATLSAGTIGITVEAGKSVAGNLRNGIWATSSQTAGNITATINGDVNGFVNGVILNPGFGALFTGGTATLKGTGTIEAGSGYGAWLLNNNAPIIIDGPTSITSGLSGIVTQSFGTNAAATTSIANVGTVTGTAGYGIYSRSQGGNLSIQNTGNTGGITGAVDAINAFMFGGNINIGGVTKNGVITGGADGIVANTTGAGTITVAADKAITGTLGYGIWTADIAGAQTITTSGAVSGLLSGLYLNTISGNIVADGKGTGTTSATGIGSTGATMGNAVLGVMTGDMTIQNYAAITGAATGVWMVGGTGTANVLNNGAITGAAIDGVLIGTTTGAINVKNNGPISGAYGVVTVGGLTTVDNNGAINGTAGSGVWATTADGAISVKGNGAITGGLLDGIDAWSTSGNINIGKTKANGAIKGLRDGIWASTLGAGTIDIVTNDVTGTTFYGIYTTATAGETNVTATGAVKAASTGIYQTSTTGNVTATGGGTGTVDSTLDIGVRQNPTTTGNAATNDFASITGLVDGIYQLVGSGTADVQGNGAITGTTIDGVLVTALGGNVNIGNVKTNGVIQPESRQHHHHQLRRERKVGRWGRGHIRHRRHHRRRWKIDAVSILEGQHHPNRRHLRRG